MRKSKKQLTSQPTISNLAGVDFHSFIERESILTELEISRELGISIGDVRQLKKSMIRKNI